MNEITLYHGDCLIEMNKITDKSVDMILCDLPYGAIDCKWDIIIPFDKLWEQYNRIIKDNGTIALFGNEPFSSLLRTSNIKMFKYDWYWKKTKQANYAQAPYMPLKNIEIISIFSKGTIAENSKMKMNYYPQGTKSCNIMATEQQGSNNFRPNRTSKKVSYIRTVTNYPKQLLEFNSCGKVIHPTQKPTDLLEYLIKTYTLENETVLDNCMGSGSTGVACLNTNRNFIGIEKDDKYFKIAEDRINKAKESIFEL